MLALRDFYVWPRGMLLPVEGTPEMFVKFERLALLYPMGRVPPVDVSNCYIAFAELLQILIRTDHYSYNVG